MRVPHFNYKSPVYTACFLIQFLLLCSFPQKYHIQKYTHFQLSDVLSAMKSAVFTAVGLAVGVATACVTPPDAPYTCPTKTYNEDIGVRDHCPHLPS